VGFKGVSGEDDEQMTYEKGFVLYAGWDADEAVQYVRGYGLNSEQVKIVKNDSGVYVVCKIKLNI